MNEHTCLLSSYKCIPLIKYKVNACVLLTHCNAAFMKHVLPRLFKPVAPRSVGTERNNIPHVKGFRRKTKSRFADP